MTEDDKRAADLDWLYRQEPSTPPPPAADPTRVMPAVGQNRPGTPRADQSRPAQNTRPRPGQSASAGRPAPRQPRPPSASRAPVAAQPAPRQPMPPGQPGVGQPPRQNQPAPPQQPGRRRRRVGALRTVLMLAVIALAWLIGVPLFHLQRAASIDATPAGDRPAQQPGTAILLAGNDSRPNVAGARTDSMMILFIPDQGKPALISLPRDSYLPIPGHGRNKLNAAYAFGGPKLLTQTVESVTGLRIDGYLEVSMQSFPQVVDAVDGIELCLKKAIKDRPSKSDFPAGCQHMTGSQALSYARMRKADPRGDLGRMERQREVIAAITKKAASPATLLPWRYWKLSEAGTQLVTRSSDTSLGELSSAAMAFRTISSGGGVSVTVPIANANAQTAAGSSVLWNKEQAAAMFADLARGDTSKVTSYH